MSNRDQFITRASYAVSVHRDQVAKVLDADGDEITDGDFTTPLDGCIVVVELRMVRDGDPIIVREARRVLPMGAGHEVARSDDGEILREVVADDDELARRAAAALAAAEAAGDGPDGDEDGSGGDDVDLDELKVAELHELAAARNIEVSAKATKAELIAALASAEAADDAGES